MKNKKLIRLTESDLHRIVRGTVNRVLKESQERDKAYIVYDGIKFLLTMNGDDMYIEYTENDRWVLAWYHYREKTWYLQENFDEADAGPDNIVDIAETKSMPEALAQLARYIRTDRSHMTYLGDRRAPEVP